MDNTTSDKGTVVVTGASRGLGLNMARHLADQGFRVFAGCRSPDAPGLADVNRAGVVPLPLDVTSHGSI